ncbi:MAG TPA: VOC family protein [Terriglobales bacterium]|jgi:catechol 2,3-dioxygenase-like lactoylglutathione lyase family enzyme|nr:VOC family protein [Terriglobales bacterium]
MIDRLDHLVLTVKDVDATCRFYEQVLGMEIVTFAGGRKGLAFGRNKINLHQQGREFEPKAHKATAGSADFCLITETPIAHVVKRLEQCGVAVAHGPVEKIGALGPMLSVYFRDPDLNLVEVANYNEKAG